MKKKLTKSERAFEMLLNAYLEFAKKVGAVIAAGIVKSGWTTILF
jgi:hypothetical protein